MADIAVFGRWASEGSCRLYIRSAEAALHSVDQDATDDCRRKRNALAEMGTSVFHVTLMPGGFVVSLETVSWFSTLGLGSQYDLDRAGALALG